MKKGKLYQRRDNYMCVRCGSIDDLTKDHVIPTSKGGVNRMLNIQTCHTCNSEKADSIIQYTNHKKTTEYLKSQGYSKDGSPFYGYNETPTGVSVICDYCIEVVKITNAIKSQCKYICIPCAMYTNQYR